MLILFRYSPQHMVIEARFVSRSVRIVSPRGELGFSQQQPLEERPVVVLSHERVRSSSMMMIKWLPPLKWVLIEFVGRQRADLQRERDAR